MIVRPAEPADVTDWERMRQALWPSSDGEHAGEIERYFGGCADNPAEVLVACDEAGTVFGFAELSIRPYAEECYSGRVAYLEGWYVDPDHRRTGAGHALIEAAEDWGRARGCTEMASDTEIGNVSSDSAHRAAGFEETNRLITYRKAL